MLTVPSIGLVTFNADWRFAFDTLFGLIPINWICCCKEALRVCIVFNSASAFCKFFFAPALPLAEVFDPTGAGDTFAGGFMGYLAKTDDTSMANMKRAIIAGSAMASFCVEDFSLDRLRTLNDTEINDRLDKFKDLVHFDFK